MTKAVLRRRWVTALWMLSLVGCGVADDGELIVKPDMTVQPEVVTEATSELNAAPSRSSMLDPGGCVVQSDCAERELCVAIAPGQTECMPASDFPDLHLPRIGPEGRPVPPIGLLDGQAMRAHAERSMQ